MAEDGLQAAIGLIQLVIVSIILAMFIGTFFDALPDAILGPFRDVAIFVTTIPWIFAILGILALLTMVLEVLEV